MVNWLHTNIPDAILVNFGFLQIYWYGFLFVIAIILAIVTAIKLAEYYHICKDLIIDLSFWLIIFGIIGARLYHIGLEYQYYLENPLNIIKIWNGGLAIHGGIIAGVLVVLYFSKKRSINFFQLSSIIVPGLALAQCVGRWGNYFNHELYGKITDLPFGIPIIDDGLITTYHHPTFIYESIGNFIIFVLLLFCHKYFLINNMNKKENVQKSVWLVLSYLIMYSILRFSTEFLRIDSTPVLLGWRLPQIVSIFIILACLIYIVYYFFNKHRRKK